MSYSNDNGKISFEAEIKKVEGKNASYIEPPFDVQAVLGAKRVKVKVTFDDYDYRGSLVFMGGRYMLGVTQEIRTAIGKTYGDVVSIVLEKDEAERTVAVPALLTEAFKSAPEA